MGVVVSSLCPTCTSKDVESLLIIPERGHEERRRNARIIVGGCGGKVGENFHLNYFRECEKISWKNKNKS